METLTRLAFAFLAAGVCSLPFIIPAIWLHLEIKKSQAKLDEQAWRANGQIIDVEARVVTDEARQLAP